MPKFGDYTASTAPNAGDLLLIKDVVSNSTKKITRSNLLVGTALPSNTVTTAAITDDSVTAAKIDWAATGANSGIWWEELGRTSLVGAGDNLSIATISARKYLKIMFSLVPTGGTINNGFRFNNDSGSNYAYRRSIDGGADSAAGSQSYFFMDAGSTAANHIYGEVYIVNIATQEKLGSATVIGRGAAGGANAPNKVEWVCKWGNTTDQITRVDAINQGGTGDFAIGSELIVLGHN